MEEKRLYFIWLTVFSIWQQYPLPSYFWLQFPCKTELLPLPQFIFMHCTWWSFQKIMPALVTPPFKPHNGFMLHLKLRRSAWQAEPYRICPHSYVLPLCSQLPVFSTLFYLNYAHHFFNSSDSPGSFTSQGLCTYSFYLLEICPLYS